MHYGDSKCAQCGARLDWNCPPPDYVEPVSNAPGFCDHDCFFKFIGVPSYELEKRPPADPGEEPLRLMDGKLLVYANRAQYLDFFDYDERKRIAALKRDCSERYKHQAGTWRNERHRIERERKEDEWNKQETARLKQKAIDDEKERKQLEEYQQQLEEIERMAEEQRQKEAQIAEWNELALNLPFDVMYQHIMILGGTGAGKTHLLQELILNLLDMADTPGMIVIDPKGLMVKRLAKLAVFNDRLKDRLVIIDATRKPYPALNLFADTSRNEDEREMLFSHAISTFRYIFSSGGFKFTPKQANCFGYCVALMFAMRGTLTDLQALLRKGGENNPRVRAAMLRIPHAHKPFFASDFSGPAYTSTRDEVLTRLNELSLIPSFVGMFDQPDRSVDIFDCIQKRKIVLVNTGLDKSRTTSQIMGRLFIAMLLNAAYMRANLPKSQHHPCFLFADEFQEFIDDEKTPELLRLVREYNIGVTIAFHNMHGAELSDALRVVISGSTRTKFAAMPSGRDLNYVAQDFGCDPRLFAQHSQTRSHAVFIGTVRGIIPPTPISVPWQNVEKEPQMTQDQAEAHYISKALQMGPKTPAYEADDDDQLYDEIDDDDPAVEWGKHVPWPKDMPAMAPATKAEDDPDYFPRS